MVINTGVIFLAEGLTSQLMRVGAPVGVGGVAYCGLYWLLGGRELGMLLRGRIVDG